jgi:hypothetical protein
MSAEPSHGQYYAQELVLDVARGDREQLQEALDAGEARDWRLVGVTDIPASTGGASGAEGTARRAVILFWDTERPSFGRSGG